MSTLSNPAQAAGSVRALWRVCARCDESFPAEPGQEYCRSCDPDSAGPSRCESAHPEDRSPCEGPGDGVLVIDRTGDRVFGCVRHAAVVLASVEGARVYPVSLPGAAIDAYRQAQTRAPFRFDAAEPSPLPDATATGGVW